MQFCIAIWQGSRPETFKHSFFQRLGWMVICVPLWEDVIQIDINCETDTTLWGNAIIPSSSSFSYLNTSCGCPLHCPEVECNVINNLMDNDIIFLLCFALPLDLRIAFMFLLFIIYPLSMSIAYAFVFDVWSTFTFRFYIIKFGFRILSIKKSLLRSSWIAFESKII